MKGFLKAALRLGVGIEYGKAVTAIERNDKRVTGVVAGEEHIPADIVLLASYPPDSVGMVKGWWFAA